MKVAILVADDQVEQISLGSIDHSNIYEIIPINKRTAVRQILDLDSCGQYDVFLNLCNGSWNDERPGLEVIQTLHKINAAYAGADPIFFNLTKQAMKVAAYSCGISIANQKLVDRDDGDFTPSNPSLNFTPSNTSLNFTPSNTSLHFTPSPDLTLPEFSLPAIVKRPNGHDCGSQIVDEIVVSNLVDMKKEAARMVQKFRAALIEEIIDGPEFAVLVSENPDMPSDPLSFLPVERKSIDNLAIQWNPVTDRGLINRLTETAKNVFLACAGTGYALLKMRRESKSDRIYFIDLIPNCRLLCKNTAKNACCPANYILGVDQKGWEKFLASQFDSAKIRRQKRRINVKVEFDATKGFHIVAKKDFEPGDLVTSHEMKPAYLVSRNFVEKNWKTYEPYKFSWLQRYGNLISKNVFTTWHEDGNEWFPFNHSCDPNCWLDGLDTVARKPIKRAEELTLDYGTYAYLDSADANEFECNCGSKECRKIVRPSQDFKSPGFAAKYAGHLADIIQEKIDNDKINNR